MQVEELRYQVRALQAVAGYGAPADGDEGSDAVGGEAGPGGRGSSSLEALLVDKARRLEHELTMARLQVADVQGALQTSVVIATVDHYVPTHVAGRRVTQDLRCSTSGSRHLTP